MISTKAERLTAQFYEWEILGRGWLLNDTPVELEPPFTPFLGHFLNNSSIVDDGIHHTLLSKVASFFSEEHSKIDQPPSQEISYQPFAFKDDSPLITLRLVLPANFKSSHQETEQFLTMLSYCLSPMSFEIIGTREAIKIQLVCRENDAHYVKSQLVTLFPKISVIESLTDYEDLFKNDKPLATIDFGLSEEFMRPLSMTKGSLDTLTGIFSIAEDLDQDESVVVQVLFNGTINQWGPSVIRSVSNAKGDVFFGDAPEMLPMAKEKVNHHFFAATIRVLSQASTLDESFALSKKLIFALTANSQSQGNKLRGLGDSNYSIEQRVADIVFRQSHRVGMLLNSKELANFVHLPESSLITKKLLSNTRKTKAAPSITEGHTLKLGYNEHQGVEKIVTLNNEQRLKHTHIIGATGTGKSTLLLSTICQDIENGEGVAILDPHGDLIEGIVSRIPISRIKDVVIIDPSDSEFPIGFNILKAHSDIEKEVLSSDLVAAFKRLSTSWGDQMNSVFANAILAFLESNEEGTLIDVRRFLIEKLYREKFLSTVSDPSVIYYWQKEFPLLKSNSIGPILTRLDTFLRPKLIRNMLAQRKGIDFNEILDSKKILLVKLSQGLIGQENSYLLGTLVVSKIHQAALTRQASESRNDFFLYIDEFQHFITPSMSNILSGARKYHLGLILAHQDLQQLQKYDSELLSALISNSATRICFRLGDIDAKRLADGFSFFEAQDLQNLNTGEAIVRIDKAEHDFSLSTIPFEDSEISYADRNSIINFSRQTYGTPIIEVEELLRRDINTKWQSEVKKVEEESSVDIISPILQYKPQSLFKGSEIKIESEVTLVPNRKEETQHRYLQTLIKKMAESNGYKATLEMPTPDRKGKVDVSLEKGESKIAVEVSVTTPALWEVHNIEKCMQAGYGNVLVCTNDPKSKKLLQDKVAKSFNSELQHRIKVFEPDELFLFFEMEKNNRLLTETKMKGYRIKVDYESISDEDTKRKRESIAKVVLSSLSKLKK